ncbi:MAG: DNA adenine methylase [Deltaproteobacteria bacterium]|nr:DNA adenine methylase [Deltaproteobacteria bacterium]
MSKPVIPWIGGKRRLAKRILPLFPDHECYVEPFCGAAALFFMKKPAQSEVLNDINLELASFYRVLKHHLDEFIKQFKWTLVHREIFKWLQDTPPETLTDIQRAARFYYLQKLAFGGKVDSQTYGTATTSKPRLNLLRIEEDLSQAWLRLARVHIESMDWKKCISKYDRKHTLAYLDPPYYGTEGYGVAFNLEEYSIMADMARSIKGKMIISVNDIPEMRRAFKGLSMDTVKIKYTVGGNDKAVNRRELIIKSW